MSVRKPIFILLGMLLIFSMLLTACGGATPTEEVTVEEPAAEEPAAEEPAAEEPAVEEPASSKPWIVSAP